MAGEQSREKEPALLVDILPAPDESASVACGAIRVGDDRFLLRKSERRGSVGEKSSDQEALQRRLNAIAEAFGVWVPDPGHPRGRVSELKLLVKCNTTVPVECFSRLLRACREVGFYRLDVALDHTDRPGEDAEIVRLWFPYSTARARDTRGDISEGEEAGHPLPPRIAVYKSGEHVLWRDDSPNEAPLKGRASEHQRPGAALDREALREHLTATLQAFEAHRRTGETTSFGPYPPKPMPVLIDVANDVKWRRLLTVLEVCRGLGLTNVHFVR
jgi:hypothetical protein